MQTSKLRKFASYARKSLIEQVGTRMKSVLAEGSLARRESPKAVADLEAKIEELGREQTIETVAYTWFNRFCALRYMDVNRYTKIGVVSPAEGQFQPEILAEAKMGHVDEELVPAASGPKRGWRRRAQLSARWLAEQGARIQAGAHALRSSGTCHPEFLRDVPPRLRGMPPSPPRDVPPDGSR